MDGEVATLTLVACLQPAGTEEVGNGEEPPRRSSAGVGEEEHRTLSSWPPRPIPLAGGRRRARGRFCPTRRFSAWGITAAIAGDDLG